MSPTCTAPVRGHRNGTAANCPVHGHPAHSASPKLPSPAALPKVRLPGSAKGRWRLSKDPSLSPAVLAALAGDEDWTVRCNVAANPSMPPGVLVTLAGDSHLRVRSAVAANPSTPAGALVTLAGDDDWHVRAYVVANPSASPEVLATLAEDADFGGRNRAAAALAARTRNQHGADETDAATFEDFPDQEW